ncbi:hypothetical protein [Tenacibaculum amylolyticum]|uniref:hypothetical protein n=1 Tax=Tenacibaculum amylolyticum TaxID=104269 RepID=UPI003895B228
MLYYELNSGGRPPNNGGGFYSPPVLTTPVMQNGGGNYGNAIGNIVGGIPGANTFLNLLGIDFNCWNAALPPKKAKAGIEPHVRRKYREAGYEAAFASGNIKRIEAAVNYCLKSFEWTRIWRLDMANHRKGCTRDGELLLHRYAVAQIKSIFDTLSQKYQYDIYEETDTYNSGLFGAIDARTTYRQVRIKSSKTETPNPPNTGGSKPPVKPVDPKEPKSPSKKPDGDGNMLFNWWWLLLLIPIFGIPYAIYKLIQYLKNKK